MIKEYQNWTHTFILMNRSDLLTYCEQISEWMYKHCSKDFTFFYDGSDWIFCFMCEEDKVKFILRWL